VAHRAQVCAPTSRKICQRPGIFSEDAAELDRFLDEIQAGVVYVNRRAGATTGAWPGNAVLLRLEIERLDRQGRPRPLLPDAVHARAEPDRGRVGGRASG
jgi:hypothetical protein